jgi:hypothetical protein
LQAEQVKAGEIKKNGGKYGNKTGFTNLPLQN